MPQAAMLSALGCKTPDYCRMFPDRPDACRECGGGAGPDPPRESGSTLQRYLRASARNDIGYSAFYLLCRMIAVADKHTGMLPSGYDWDRLMVLTGMPRRTLGDALNELDAKGLIDRIARRKGRQRLPNEYRVTV